MKNEATIYICDFCKKNHYEVEHIFKAADDTAICSECVTVCQKALDDIRLEKATA